MIDDDGVMVCDDGVICCRCAVLCGVVDATVEYKNITLNMAYNGNAE